MAEDRPERGTRRPGEVALSTPPELRAGLAYIGTIRSDWHPGNAPKNIRAARETGKTAHIELEPDYLPGLAGLSAGQPIIVLYWVDRGQRDLIVQTPRHADGPRGVFALRSPVRPNPIAVACVTLTGIDGPILHLDAIDAWDGTPVLDIKPWLPTVDAPPDWRAPS